jgi:hypothetical protein
MSHLMSGMAVRYTTVCAMMRHDMNIMPIIRRAPSVAARKWNPRASESRHEDVHGTQR